MKWIVAVMMLALIRASPAAAQPETVYVDVTTVLSGQGLERRYSIPADPWIFRIDGQDIGLSRGDAGGDIGSCDDDHFLCLNTPALPFAVPKGQLPSTWEFRSRVYRLLDLDREVQVLGATYEVAVFTVDVPDEDPARVESPWRYAFYYSRERGLLAFTQEVVDCDAVPRESTGGYSMCGAGGIFLLAEGRPLFAAGEDP